MNIKPDLGVVGKRQPRLDGRDKVSGRSVFTDDLTLPGMLHGKVVRSPYARARIVNIDTSKAARLPGVKAILTADNVPGILIGENRPIFAQDIANYVGEDIAAVAAVDEVTAEKARELIEVEYEPLPSVTTVKRATKPGAPLVHGQTPGNLALDFDKDFGDPDEAFSRSDYVLSDKFGSPANHNQYAEFHIGVVDFTRPDRLEVWTPTQSAHNFQTGMGKVFGLSQSQVRVSFLNVGGAFTGRGGPKPHHYVAAVLSRETGRPVKVRATGDEEFLVGNSAGGNLFHFKTGVSKDGKINAIEAEIILDCGAHQEGQAMLAVIPAGSLSRLFMTEDVRYHGQLVYTNNKPYFCHHGGPIGQLNAGWMQHLTRVAEKIDMDPIDFFLANAVEAEHKAPDGAYLGSCGLKECLEKVSAASGWKDKYGKLPPYHGIGVGIGSMSSGAKGAQKHDTSAAFVKVADDGIVTLYTGIPDMGQGTHTTMAIIAAEVLGVEASDVRVVAGDTDVTPLDPGAYAQRGTFVTGNGVKAAAEDARDQIAKTAAAELEVEPSDLIFRGRSVFPKGAPDRAIPFDKVVYNTLHSEEGRFVMGRGFYNSPVPFGSMAYSFGAQVAEVEVDPETGRVKVHKVTVAHDLGRAMNPLAVEGQIDGQVFSGMSQVLYEECVMDEGQTLNPSRLEYKLPRTYEMPDIEYIIVETIDPFGPFGAKEVGEGPIVVSMAAVASAVANALGGMMPEIPMTPWRVLRAIKQREQAAA